MNSDERETISRLDRRKKLHWPLMTTSMLITTLFDRSWPHLECHDAASRVHAIGKVWKPQNMTFIKFMIYESS